MVFLPLMACFYSLLKNNLIICRLSRPRIVGSCQLRIYDDFLTM